MLLGPVINQFSLMQQQMLEQFHQTMVMMAQLFGNLHRDQMALIREELDQLRRVTEELQTLHVELARSATPGPLAGNDSPRPAAGPTGATAAARRLEGGTRTPPASTPAPEPVGTQPAAKQQRDGPPPAPEGAADIHLLLRRRMAALEQERKSRWEKVLHFMLGR
jgi:hypothetical protein